MVQLAGGLIGRDEEVAALDSFLDPGSPSLALALEGEAGIGKTTLWQEGIRRARERGYLILSCRPSDVEIDLPYSALADLLEPVIPDALSVLPDPQQRALRVALLLEEPTGAPPNQRAVAAGLLGVLQSLARKHLVLVAVDDIHWMDRPSALVLDYAVRRLAGEQARLLVSLRPEAADLWPLTLERAIPEHRIRRLRLGGLSLGALSRLVIERLGHGAPRPILRQIHELTGGNPFYALEFVRALDRRGAAPRQGEPLPVPRNGEALVSERIGELLPDARAILLVAAAQREPTVESLEAARPGAMALVEEGVLGPILELDGDRVRFAHPLLAAGVYGMASSERRREVHRRLAEVATDAEVRARHLALAGPGPDHEVAGALEEAARLARARGAPDAAAELAEQARLMTPPGEAEASHARAIDAADYHFDAGDLARSRELLEEVVASMAPGPARAGALRRLGRVRYHTDGAVVAQDLTERALAEAGDDSRLRAAIEADLAAATLMTTPTSGQVARHAEAARALADPTDPAVLAEALGILAMHSFLVKGEDPAPLLATALELEHRSDAVRLVRSSSFWVGLIQMWVGDLSAARTSLHAERRRAFETGDDEALPQTLYALAQVECRAGYWDLALEHAREAHEIAVSTGQRPYEALALYARALVEAHRGDESAARASIAEGLAIAEQTGTVAATIQHLSVLGFLELSLDNPAATDRHLGAAAGALAALGQVEPSALQFLPDEIEALIALDRLEKAGALLDQFEGLGRARSRAWALATAARCSGLLLARSGDLQGALSSLQDAVRRHEGMGQPFELGRTLLAKGQVERRAGHRRAARTSLEDSLAIFEQLGARLWAGKARRELARIGGRSPSSAGLSETERRVAELVTEGKTNREVAAQLFMAERTVEWNLSKVYA